jgi:hypothetical protein
MTGDSGSERPQRTVAELLAEYGGATGDTPRRRRRRAEDDGDSAPQTIIERVLSDSGKLLPIRDEQQSGPRRPGGHRSGERRPPAQPPAQQPQQGPPSGYSEPAPRPAAPPPAPPQQPPQPPPPQQPPQPPPPQQPTGRRPRPGRPAEQQAPERPFPPARPGPQGTAARPVPTPQQPPTQQQPPQQHQPPTQQSRPVGRPPAGPPITPMTPRPPAAAPRRPLDDDNVATAVHPPLPDDYHPPKPQPPKPLPPKPQQSTQQPSLPPMLPPTMQTPPVPPPQARRPGLPPEATTEEFPPIPAEPRAAQPVLESTQAHAGPYVDDDLDDYEHEFAPNDIGAALRSDEAFPSRDDEYGYEDDHGRAEPFDEPFDDDAGEPRSGTREWLLMAAQVGVGAIAGAAVWLAFSWLWGFQPVVALVAAVLVIFGLVLGVRRWRRAEDIQTTVLAVLAGLVVTVSPAALLLLHR